MNKELEEDIEILENLKEETKEACMCSLASGNERKDWQREVQAIENILEDRERYKRLTEQNLINSEEFKNNMCEHRCIKNNEILELQAKANKYDSLVEKIKEDIANNNFKETECLEDKGRYYYAQEILKFLEE